MRQRVVGRKSCERERSRNGLLQPACIAKRTHQPVMRLNMRRIGLNGGAECLRGLGRLAACK